MAGTTPTGLPYPTGTDRVADGDNAIQALATALDPTNNATAGTFSNGDNISSVMEVARRGRACTLAIDMTAAINHSPGSVLGTVAAGFRPIRKHYVLAYDLGTSSGVLLEVGTDGTLRLSWTGVAAGAQIVGSAAWALATNAAELLEGRLEDADHVEALPGLPDAPDPDPKTTTTEGN